MGHVGWQELVIIFAIILLIVGGRRLPEIARSMGDAIREFQRSIRGRPKDDNDKQGKT